MKITVQGKIKLSTMTRVEWTDVKIISLDLKDKWATIEGTGSDEGVPLIILSQGEKDKSYTEISFPEYKDYTIIPVEVSKYTLFIGFVKYSKHKLVKNNGKK